MSKLHKDGSDTAPTRVIIYCRVASAKASDGDQALIGQERRCRDYAASKGYSVGEVFRDRAISGRSLDRPGTRAMLQYLESRRDRVVVVVDDLNRLARDIATYTDLRSAMSAAGARLECADAGIGPDSPHGRQPKPMPAPDRRRGPKR